MKAALLTVLVCLAALALVPGKAAATPCSPPGVSGVDQCIESIPGGGCNMPPSGCRSASAGLRSLSPGEVLRLTSEGAAGRAVAHFVSSSAPPIRRAHPSTAPTARGANPIVALGRLVFTGSSTGSAARATRPPCPNSSGLNTGAGLLLPILLTVALAAAGAVLVRRWRDQAPPAQ